MTELKQIVTKAFFKQFHELPAQLAAAPGRVNLIGEHTDYNGGFVLPCAINFHTVIAAGKRDDSRIHVVAADYENQLDEFSLDQSIVFNDSCMWSNYVRGVIDVLQKKGFCMGGVNLAVTGNIPQGAGLSSSASLELAVVQVFQLLFNLPLSRLEMARIGQQAENEFVGCRCGIMDQLISTCGQEGHALLIDCESLAIQPVPMPSGYKILIVNSGMKRGLVHSEYNQRRLQCEAAAHYFKKKSLRHVDAVSLLSCEEGMDAVTRRRARHVITENQRTIEAARALGSNDMVRMGQLMLQSHLSMMHDFEITTPEIDFLVGLIQGELDGNGGARMTGAGFGGCVVALVPSERVERITCSIHAHYQQKTGLKPEVYLCEVCDGAGTVE